MKLYRWMIGILLGCLIGGFICFGIIIWYYVDCGNKGGYLVSSGNEYRINPVTTLSGKSCTK